MVSFTLEELDQFLIESFVTRYKTSLDEFLTESIARQLENFLSQGKPNQTSLWIQEQCPELLNILKTHLSKKLPRSQALGKIEDHVQKFLEDLIRRDSIGKRNRKGKKTHLSQVKAWCVRNSHTQNRDAGATTLGRCMHGALTRKEWLSQDFNPENWSEVSAPKKSKAPSLLDLTLVPSKDGTEKDIEKKQTLRHMFVLINEILQQSVEREEFLLFSHLAELFFIRQEKIKEISYLLQMEEKVVLSKITKLKRLLRKNSKYFEEFRH